jgi:hypothetical protein
MRCERNTSSLRQGMGQAPVNKTVMKLVVSQSAGNVYDRWATISFLARKTVLYEARLQTNKK